MGSTRKADLPEEIKQEILLRLPVKSLCRFKCVCKQWCALIGSPSFVNKHFCHESNQERLLVRHDRPDKEEYVFTPHFDEMCCRYEESDHLQFPKQVAKLTGPLNGVFWVIGYTGATALLNPAMRQFKPLPLLHTRPPQLSLTDFTWGFGLDPSSGDYKLVFIRFRAKTTLVSVCNSSSDSWRDFEDVDLVNIHCGDMPERNRYLNGIYYWLIKPYLDKKSEFAILAFDMSTEKFQTIQPPDCIKSNGDSLGTLTLCGDSLAYLACDFENLDKCCIEVWMMKNERCWIKYQTVGPFQGIPWSLGIWKNGELLVCISASHLVLCNLSTQKLRTIECEWKDTGPRINAIFYKESLVSIKGEGDKCMLWDTSSKFVKDILQ